MTQLIFNIPPKDAPGFYHRQRRILELKRARVEDPTPEVLDQLAEFLADYVQAEMREEQLKLIHEASQADWEMLLDALGGASAEVPPPNSETSENPSQATT